MTAEPFALRLEGISKAYSVPVLTDVGFDLKCGEVHALIGANGAGKSTLARIVCGLVAADAGRMQVLGEDYAPSRKADAEAAGVHIVQQELNLIPTLTVAESLFLNRLPSQLGFVSRSRLHEAASAALRAVGLDSVDPRTPVGRLGVGQQQLVEIASALSRNLKILILDEPTAALTRPEIDLLFARIAGLKEAGAALIYISHRMDEIRTIADRVSVLCDGRVIATCAASQASTDSMISLMTGAATTAGGGADIKVSAKPALRDRGAPLLQVSGLNRGPLTRNVSFAVHRGEILGLSGLVGSGRTETLRAVFGADRPESGTVSVGDPLRVVRIRSPRDAVRAGIGMLPEDRKAHGLLLTQAIASNVTLASMKLVSRGVGWMSRRHERDAAESYASRLRIRCAGVGQAVRQLSGGNQQKVLLARWLMRDCDVLLFDEPTRGIDVSARASIYELLNELAAAGKALVVASSDLEELLEISDRIAVISAGRIAAEFDRGEWTEEKIMAAAFSGYARRESGASDKTEARQSIRV